LLVVIAVIGILAALLLPALHRAREAGYSTACRSNLRQWGLGLRMYVDDYKVYPPSEVANMVYEECDLRPWYERLERYTGGKAAQWTVEGYEPDKGVAACPGYARLPNPYYGPEDGSYGYNGNGIGGMGLIAGADFAPDMQSPVRPDPTTKESQVLSPSEMIAIGDALLVFLRQQAEGCRNLSPLYTAGIHSIWYELGMRGGVCLPNDAAMTRRRHGGRFNVVFCDGHVENLRTADLFDIRRDEVLARWNRDHLPHRELLPPWAPR
jgi:prepilin-type processing-associated H-X9-DG protein